jgi:hypothetical protein
MFVKASDYSTFRATLIVLRVLGGKPVPLKKFVAEATKANAAKGKSGWDRTPQPASPSGAKSPLAEQPPKGPVNACSLAYLLLDQFVIFVLNDSSVGANPIKIPPALRTKPSPTPTAPSTRSQSPWGTIETAKEPCSCASFTNNSSYSNIHFRVH